MEKYYYLIGLLILLTFIAGFLLGMLLEARKQTHLFNGNVLITIYVEEMLNICYHPDKSIENKRIREGIKLLSEGFSVSEISQIINQQK